MRIVRGIILIFMIGISGLASAQFKAFGVKTGINYGASDIKEKFQTNGVDYTYATREADVGLTFGVFGRFKIHNYFFQPELLASNHETRMKLSSVTLDSFFNLKQTRMDIPLLIGYSRKDRVRGYMGPVFTKLTDHPVFSEKFFRDEFSTLFSGGTWAFQLGFGFDMGPLAIDARYETNLGQFSDRVAIQGRSFQFDHRMSSVQVQVGWDFVR